MLIPYNLGPKLLLCLFWCCGNVGVANAQHVIWADEFENSCSGGCYASAYSGVNGAWSVVNVGTQGACANQWFISCQENGNAVGACGSACGNNESLHIANELSSVCASALGCYYCPSGDCGAAYDAGCPPAICAFCCSCLSALTNKRVQSPVINLTGQTSITLSFKYMENGQGTFDDFLLEYYNGTIWAPLSNPPKTPTAVCSGQGQWTQYSIALPASANNNPNVRIGLRWQNDNDGSGNDPSVAIDDVELSVPYEPTCVGPIVNEISNGASGEKEYIELLVCGPQCSTIDLRNWIIDDNNGPAWNGFGTTMVNSGVGAGHIRFSNAAQWAAVPTGSLIVIYNDADVNASIPANDLNDTSPVDSIYIVPVSNALFQRCNTSPNATTTSGYFPCTYSTGGSWNNISFRNAGDAAQTRYPDGRFFHGISYGPNTQNMNTGGIENMRISIANHAGRVIYFNSVDPRVATNYTSAVIAGNETPGAVNNAANAAYRNNLLCESPLPIQLLDFGAMNDGSTALLQWTTTSELENEFFTVERSSDLNTWNVLFTTPGAGTSFSVQHYRGHDTRPIVGTGYYRLRQTDLDGRETLSNTVSLYRNSKDNALQATLLQDGSVLLEHPCTSSPWTLTDMMGRKLAEGLTSEGPSTILHLPDAANGVVALTTICGSELITTRIVR